MHTLRETGGKKEIRKVREMWIHGWRSRGKSKSFWLCESERSTRIRTVVWALGKDLCLSLAVLVRWQNLWRAKKWEKFLRRTFSPIKCMMHVVVVDAVVTGDQKPRLISRIHSLAERALDKIDFKRLKLASLSRKPSRLVFFSVIRTTRERERVSLVCQNG